MKQKYPLLDVVWEMLNGEMSIRSAWEQDRTALSITGRKGRQVCLIQQDGDVRFDKGGIGSYAEMNMVNRVRKTVTLAQEKCKLLENAEAVVISDGYYDNNFLILTSFHDICLLQTNHAFSGAQYYVWEKNTTLDRQKIFYDYEDAKKEYAKRAGLISDSLDFTELHAIYEAICYYKENRPKREPINKDTIEQVQRHLLRVCPSVDGTAETGFPSYEWGEETGPSYDDEDYGDDDYDDDELHF